MSDVAHFEFLERAIMFQDQGLYIFGIRTGILDPSSKFFHIEDFLQNYDTYYFFHLITEIGSGQFQDSLK